MDRRAKGSSRRRRRSETSGCSETSGASCTAPVSDAAAEQRCTRCHGVRAGGRRRQTSSSEAPSSHASDRLTSELAEVGARYVGEFGRREVEAVLNTNEFVLYHARRVEGATTPLMIAYKTAFNDCRHYAVRKLTAGHEQFHQPHTYYYVDAGPDKPLCFSSLAALIRYYEVYNRPTGDAVPWWQLSAPDKLRERRRRRRSHRH